MTILRSQTTKEKNDKTRLDFVTDEPFRVQTIFSVD